MFSRYILAAFCIIALFAFVNVRAEEASEEVAAQSTEVGDDPRANPIMKAVAKALGSAFTWAAGSCIWEAVNHCKGQLKHFKQAVNCGKNYLKQNKGRCAVGK